MAYERTDQSNKFSHLDNKLSKSVIQKVWEKFQQSACFVLISVDTEKLRNANITKKNSFNNSDWLFMSICATRAHF